MSHSSLPKAEQRAFFVAVTGLAIATWPIVFNLGVYQTVFYSHLLSIFAASIAILLADWSINRRSRSDQLVDGGGSGEHAMSNVIWKTSRMRWRGRLILMLPSLWFTVEVVTYYYPYGALYAFK